MKFTKTNKLRLLSIELLKGTVDDMYSIASGGNSLFPVGGQSLLNFRQNFEISDVPPPHLHSKRLFLALF
jgi:hypothetical protein